MSEKNWKADEMEMTINFKAMRFAYVFAEIALIVYCIVMTARTGDLPTWPFVILCASGCVFFGAKLWMTRKMSEPEGGDEE